MSNIMVSQELMEFLNKLQQNNDRDWFSDHKEEFKKIETEAKSIFKSVFTELNQNDNLDSFKMFRIYRDVRFSKNKLPYKIHFGGSFHRRKPELRGGYFLKIQPNNNSFIGAGFWDPSKEDLFRIRKEFELNPDDIRTIIGEKNFKKTWGNFEGEELKTAPKGFDKEHPSIDLIRKKQFVFTKNYSDEEVMAIDFLDDVNSSFKAIRPYFDYMSEVLTTNLNGESII